MARELSGATSTYACLWCVISWTDGTLEKQLSTTSLMK